MSPPGRPEGEYRSAQHEGSPISGAGLVLDGELTIYRAAELKPQLLAALEAGLAADAEPAFDLSAVTEIDTSGVQLLLLAQREAAARGRLLRLVAASPAVRDAFALLELDTHLQP